MGTYPIFKLCMCQHGRKVVFFMIRPESVEDFKKKTTFCMICTYMIPKVCFMDFGLLLIRKRSRRICLRLFTCLVYLSTYCVPIAHLKVKE